MHVHGPCTLQGFVLLMPTAPRRPCPRPGCPNLVPPKCPVHTARPWEHGRASSAERGYGAAWRKLRELVLAEEPLCRVCGGRPSVMADHIVPKTHGGTDDRENLRGICKRCHDTKSGREGRASR